MHGVSMCTWISKPCSSFGKSRAFLYTYYLSSTGDKGHGRICE